MRGTRSVFAQPPARPSTVHYEIANLTSYGGDTGFPITTEATLWDLRLTHRYPNGVTIEIPLYDESGLRQVDLDTQTLFLRSDEIAAPVVGEAVEISLTGRIRPTQLSTMRGDGSLARIDVYGVFSFEAPLQDGLYEAIHVSDRKGVRSAVGTICLCHQESSLDNAFQSLRRSARTSVARASRTSARRRVGAH